MSASAHLRRLRESIDGPATLGLLAGRLGRDGIGLLAVILAMPFLQPIPLAGLGTPVGILMAAMGFQLARGRQTLALPRFVSERSLEPKTLDRIFTATERLLSAMERMARPRWQPAARMPRVCGGAMILLGLGFAIPIFVPLGNPVSAAGMIMLGLSLLEEDGLLAVLGLAATAVSVVLHVGFVVLLWRGGHALWRG